MTSRLQAALCNGVLTVEQIKDACYRRNTSLDNPGFCLCCGAEIEGVEPNARNYECEHCGEEAVFGAEELLFEL